MTSLLAMADWRSSADVLPHVPRRLLATSNQITANGLERFQTDSIRQVELGVRRSTIAILSKRICLKEIFPQLYIEGLCFTARAVSGESVQRLGSNQTLLCKLNQIWRGWISFSAVNQFTPKKIFNRHPCAVRILHGDWFSTDLFRLYSSLMLL